MSSTSLKTLCLLAVLALTATCAHAEKDFGNVDCGKWLERRKGALSLDQVSDMRWVGGYLSGLNTAWSATAQEPLKDALSELQSLSQATQWIDNYCKAKPLDSVKSAAIELFFELVERKQKSSKK